MSAGDAEHLFRVKGKAVGMTAFAACPLTLPTRSIRLISPVDIAAHADTCSAALRHQGNAPVEFRSE